MSATFTYETVVEAARPMNEDVIYISCRRYEINDDPADRRLGKCYYLVPSTGDWVEYKAYETMPMDTEWCLKIPGIVAHVLKDVLEVKLTDLHHTNAWRWQALLRDATDPEAAFKALTDLHEALGL